MKKILLALTVVVALFSLVWFVGKAFYFHKRQEKVVAFVDRFQQKVNQDVPITNGKEIWSQKDAWIYVNTGGKGSRVEETLKTFMPQSNQMGEYDSRQVERLYLLYPKKATADLKGVTALNLEKTSYSIKGLDIKKQKSKILQTLYFKDDAYKEPLTLNDLIRDKAAFRQVVEAATNQRSWSKEKKAKLLTPFEGDDWKSISFTYQKGQLHLTNSVSLPLSSFLDAIEPKYLQGDDLASYQEYLAKTREHLKRVALTFDDGPNPVTTPQVLDILKRYNAKATFFTIGQKIAGQEALLQKMIAQGNEIGNHTWSHPNLASLEVQGIKQEVTSTNEAIEKAIHKKPTLMRPPYGSTNATVQAAAGMKEILWTVDTLDWQNHSTEGIMKHVKEELTPGGIILMHDIHQTSVDALPSVLDYLKSQGYEVVTVSELYGY